MKTLGRILRVVSGALVALLSLVFLIIEVTLFATLDFALFENELIAFMQLTFRLILALGAFAMALLSIIKRSRIFAAESICLLAAMLVMAPFVTNNFGPVFVGVSALFSLSHLISLKTEY